MKALSVLVWRDELVKQRVAPSERLKQLSPRMQFVQKYAGASPNLRLETLCRIFHQEALSASERKWDARCDVCRGKIPNKSTDLLAQASAHTQRETQSGTDGSRQPFILYDVTGIILGVSLS